MEDIQNKSLQEIKAWLSANKVCFVTNSRCMPGSLYLATFKTYIDYIPLHNFWIISGEREGKPFYGVSAFMYMLNYMLTTKHFNYVIYIDEDCFITDFKELIKEFEKFKESNCCIGGPQDGGVFSHRNHSRIMINTFLSFWNIKMLLEKDITQNTLNEYYTKVLANKDIIFKEFYKDLLENNASLLKTINNNANIMINSIKKYRVKNFPNKNGETEYAQIVKDDSTNHIEPHQIPYSYSDEKEKNNFEPYYIVEQALVKLTNTPIYYMFATDFYDKEYKDENVDMSGLTSCIMSSEKNHKLFAVHTWFSRAYTKWPTTKVELNHTKRINTIIKKFSKI